MYFEFKYELQFKYETQTDFVFFEFLGMNPIFINIFSISIWFQNFTFLSIGMISFIIYQSMFYSSSVKFIFFPIDIEVIDSSLCTQYSILIIVNIYI